MERNSHLTRQEYREKYSQKSQLQNKEMTKTALKGHDISQTRADYRHLKLNFWDIFADRPYVAVAIVVLAIFLVMAKLWWLLAALAIVVAIGIFVIGRSHHPNRVLSLEFKMKSSRKLSMLQIGRASCRERV